MVIARCLLIISLLAFGAVAFSQAPVLENGTSEFGISAQHSPFNVQGIGITSNRKLSLVDLFYARVIATTDNTALKYTAGIVPVAFVTQPAEAFQPSVGPAYILPKKTLYAGGLDPIGFQWNLRRRHSVQPFFSTQGGFLYFTDQVPVPESSQFNFTFSFGTGLQFFRDTHTLTFGYKYHHISNAQTGHYNPGIDSNLFYVGFSFLK